VHGGRTAGNRVVTSQTLYFIPGLNFHMPINTQNASIRFIYIVVKRAAVSILRAPVTAMSLDYSQRASFVHNLI
jgi:hypothetical protein